MRTRIAILALLLLAAFAANGQTTAYMRGGGTSTAFICGTSASGVSPLVVTTCLPHSFVGGEEIIFNNVCRLNPSGGLTDGLSVLNYTATQPRRKVSATGITSTSFQVTDLAGTALTSNGDFAWCYQNAAIGIMGYVGKVVPVTLTAQPRAFYDGPSGIRMRELALTSSNGLTSLVVSGGTRADVTLSFSHGLATGAHVGIWNSGTAMDGTANVITVDSASSYHFVVSGVSNGAHASGTVISTYGWPGNTAWDQVVTTTNTLSSRLGSDIPYYMAQGAIRYRIDRSQSSLLTTVLNYLKKWMYPVNGASSPYFGALPCNLTQNECGAETDFESYTVAYQLGFIYDTLSPEIKANFTGPEYTTLKNSMWADVEDGCTPNSPVQTTGTVSQNGTATITGSGTSFLTEYAVGDLVYTTQNTQVRGPNLVVSIGSNTSMTLDLAPYFGGVGSGYPIYKIAQWKDGDCGLNWYLKHYAHAPTSNPALYPPDGGIQAVSDFSNTEITKMLGLYATTTAWAGDDSRATRELEKTHVIFRDTFLKFGMQYITGPNQSGTGYGFGRTGPMMSWIPYIISNATGNYEDYGLTSGMQIEPLNYLMYATFSSDHSTGGLGCASNVDDGTYMVCLALQGQATGGDNTLGATPLDSGTARGTGPAGAWLGRNTMTGKCYADWMKNFYAYSQANRYFEHFFYIDPNSTGCSYTSLPHAHIFQDNAFAQCSALFGSGTSQDQCDSRYRAKLFISNTGWGPTAHQLQIDAMDYFHGRTGTASNVYWNNGLDHQAPQATINLFVGGTGKLLGNDCGEGAGCVGGAVGYMDQEDNLPCLGANSGTYYYASCAPINNVIQIAPAAWMHTDIPNYAIPASDTYAYEQSDMTGIFAPAADVTSAVRSVVHAKGGTFDTIFVYERYILAAAHGLIASQAHFVQIGRTGEGTTTCPLDPTCASVNTNRRILETGRSNNLVAGWLDPTGANKLRVYVETGLQNGTASAVGGYPLPAGYGTTPGSTFRTRWCTTANGSTCDATATIGEFLTVYKVTNSTADTTLNLSQPATDINWTCAQTTDHVTFFARGGTTHNSMAAVTTTHSGTAQYVIAGLTPGSYTITVGGVGVTGNNCTSGTCVVPAGDTTVEFSSTAGVLSLNGASPSGTASIIGGNSKVGGAAIIH